MVEQSREPRRCTIVVPGHAMTANRRRRSHWAAQMRDSRTYRTAAALLAREAKQSGAPFVRAHLVATVLWRGQRRCDPDAAVCLLKPYIDGLVDAGVLLGDDAARLELSVSQESGSADAVRLEITELLED